MMEQRMQATKVSAEGDREIVSERVFDAPRERVFQAFTDPELIRRCGALPANATGFLRD